MLALAIPLQHQKDFFVRKNLQCWCCTFSALGEMEAIINLLPWWQVLSDGEERLQGPSLPQLDACLLCLTLLLPALQKPRAVQLPPVSMPLYFHLLVVVFLYQWCSYSSPLSSRDIEILALFVSCMCHDLDHRGTNNSFQVASVRANTITLWVFFIFNQMQRW